MEELKIGEACDILNGFAFKSEKYVDEGIRVIRIANVQKGYIEDNAPAFYPSDTEGIEKYMLVEGDLLMSLTGNVGRVAILEREMLPAALNQRVACLRLKTDKIEKGYLFHILNSDFFEKKCIQAANGVAQKNMSTEWLKNYLIPVYSREDQRKITDILDRLREVIDIRKSELEKLDDLIKARFVELFGDPVNNSKGLPEATLPELGEFGRGVSKHRPRNDPKLLGGDYPLIQTGDVAAAELYITDYASTYSELGLKQSKMWDKGTLCITIAANIAKTAILTFDACFPDSVVGFMANERTSNIFIHYWFSFFQAILEAQAPESAQKNINLKILSELKVINPSKEAQKEFERFVKQVDKSKVVIQKALNETQTLFESLMQEYFG
ncbi:MAG: restriction endonuclease subunit S [Lachnospiraceae bacterium]|nr:restriction endonuclease subunit S [Lachnospiraceae bacterium]